MDTGSEETERLCEMTADLLKSFQQMLLESRRQPAPACPCGRKCQGQDRQQLEAEQPTPPRQLQHQLPQPTVCSNLSNLTATFGQGRVVTSPSEIFLLLRLESWLDENGALVLKPSIHRASSADSAGLSSVANNNTTVRLQTAAAPQPGTSETVEEAGGDGCDDAADSAPEECEMKELMLQLQQLQRIQQHQQEQKQQQQMHLQQQQQKHQQQQQLYHNNNKRQLQPKLHEVPLAPVASNSISISSSRNPHQPQPPSNRRERALAKRTASADSGTAPAAAAGKSRGRRSPDPGETMVLIKQLHRLLDTQLKATATAQ